MAFQHSGLKWKCGERTQLFKRYDMCESRRVNAVHRRPDGDAFWRVCPVCEMDLRLGERGSWSDENRAYHGADCIAEDAIWN